MFNIGARGVVTFDSMEMKRSWFSCMIRTAVLIEGVGHSSDEKSVFVFQASSWSDARRSALSLGRNLERIYQNGAGQRVRIAFKQLATLDELLSIEPEGRQVYSEPLLVEPPDETIGFDSEYHPEDSEPEQTGV